MKQLLFLTIILLVITPETRAQPGATSFSGVWVLDRERTKDLPETLESYTLKVEQDARQLNLEAMIRGEIRPARAARGGAPGGLAGGFPGGGGRRGGGGMGGGGGMSGGGMGGSSGMGGGMGGDGPSMAIPREILMQMALAVPIRQAVFPLDGREELIDIPDAPVTDGRPAVPPVKVSLKSLWKKDGRQLELFLTRQFATPTGDRTTVNRDRWEIEKDGILVVRRQVETRMGGQEVKLYFRRSS